MRPALQLSLLFVLFTLPGVAHAQDEAARRAAGCGPNEIDFDVTTSKSNHPKGDADPAKALVYIFDHRTGVAIGGWPDVRVGVDGTWVGANLKASYFFFTIDPGAHNICTDSKGTFERLTNQSMLVTTLNAEAGQVYYLSIELHDHEYKLKELSPAEAVLQISKLPFSTSKQKPTKTTK